MISSYPKYNENDIYEDEEQKIDKVIEDITNIRNLKVTNDITKEALIKLETEEEIKEIFINALKIKEENKAQSKPEEYEEYNYKSNYIDITFYQKGKEINKELLITEIEKLEISIEKRKRNKSNNIIFFTYFTNYTWNSTNNKTNKKEHRNNIKFSKC